MSLPERCVRGPWRVSLCSGVDFPYMVEEHTETEVRFFAESEGRYFTAEESDLPDYRVATARLIAAAPELYLYALASQHCYEICAGPTEKYWEKLREYFPDIFASMDVSRWPDEKKDEWFGPEWREDTDEQLQKSFYDESWEALHERITNLRHAALAKARGEQ